MLWKIFDFIKENQISLKKNLKFMYFKIFLMFI